MSNKKIGQKSRGAFSHLLTGTLSKFIEEQMEQPPEDQNDLQQELALTRAAAMVTIEKFNAAVEAGEKDKMYMVGKAMKHDLQNIADMAAQASRIQATRSDQMTKSAVENIIGTIIDIIFNVLRGESRGLEIAATIEKEIYAKISMTADKGTVILPSDDIVKLMDNTIGGDADSMYASDSERASIGGEEVGVINGIVEKGEVGVVNGAKDSAAGDIEEE